MKMIAKLLSIILLIGIASCSSGDEPSNQYRPIELNLKAQQTIESSNQFGFNLFAELTERKPENLMISPFSISQALDMTWNGASNTTFDEMTSVLCLPDEDAEIINQANQAIREALIAADSKIDLGIANSIWYREGYPIASDFLAFNKNYYDAEVEGLDFSKKEESKTTINNWVDDKTKGRISKIVDDITPGHVMFLINAVYFKGKWTYQFEKDETQDRAFNLINNSSVDVPTMHVEADLAYYEDAACRYVSIPYGNAHFEMIIALPNEGSSLPDFIAQLDDEAWGEVVNQLEIKGMSLFLPKFTFKNDLKLNKPLIDLGMTSAFSDGADFSRMNADGIPELKIDKVKHKTFVEVNEEGTEAAAVTSVEVVYTTIGQGGSPMVFNVDRPFLFVIREKDTGAILFLGQVYQPEV